VKDYFLFGRGPSFTIADSRKPGIYRGVRRVRAALGADGSAVALVGVTAGMALGVSLVEFACTAGFPLVWSATLAAHDVGAAAFGGLLALYLGIYLLDEAVVFGVAVLTLRAFRMEERHGRILKLVGGTVMLALAGVMALAPETLSSLSGSVAVFGGAGLATAVILLVHSRLRPYVARRARSQPDVGAKGGRSAADRSEQAHRIPSDALQKTATRSPIGTRGHRKS
jgi:hypothetical protein